MRRLLFAVMPFAVATICFAQNNQQQRPKAKIPTRPSTSLAKPVDWGIFTARLFSDSQKVSFNLATSWIPGENHKGSLRYKLNAFPENPDPKKDDDTAIAEAEEKLMRRVSSCSITLKLYDSDGFILRKIDATFELGVDDRAQVHSLTANDAIQMDAQEYRNFLGTLNSSGGWNVSWACTPL